MNDQITIRYDDFDLSEEEIQAQICAEYKDTMFYTDSKGNSRLNEHEFSRCFIRINNLQYHNGLFYSRRGKISDEGLTRDIAMTLEGREFNIHSGVAKLSKDLLGAVKLMATVDSMEVDPDIIPLANGDFKVSEWTFYEHTYSPTPYRLPVAFTPNPPPTPNFDKWLYDLFEDEDILTIQQYLGYTLVPSTKAQKALFLVGAGGSGKSVMGTILESLLGKAVCNTPDTKQFLADKFKLAELEHKLVLYDDDLDSSALDSTGLYKKLITNTQAITADRKFGQPFTFVPQIKLICCCNQFISSIYDNTDGFYRRLLPIKIKPKRADFVPDLNFNEKIQKEASGVLLWALKGLKCLLQDKWVLHSSVRSEDYLKEKREDGDDISMFARDCLVRDRDGTISTTELLAAYGTYNTLNGRKPRSNRTVQTWFSDNCENFGMTRSSHIKRGEGEVRGYTGVRLKSDKSKKDSTKVEKIKI